MDKLLFLYIYNLFKKTVYYNLSFISVVLASGYQALCLAVRQLYFYLNFFLNKL